MKTHLALLTVMITCKLAAQDTASAELDQVIVTAQRQKHPAVAIPYSVKAVNRQYLDAMMPRSAPEALTGLNGVFVQKTNHGGGSPFLRGFTGNQVLVLVDGIRLNNATFRYGPNQYLNTIDVNSINRLEIVRGTGAVPYGSDAIGGVLQLFTHEPGFSKVPGSLHGHVTGRYVTQNMEKSYASSLEYSRKRLAIAAGFSLRDFGHLYGGDTTGRQSPSGYKEWALNVKGKMAITEKMQLTLAHQFLQQRHVPVYHKVVLENFALNEFEPQQRMLNYAKLSLQGRSRWITQVEATVSWQQTVEGRVSRKNGSSISRHEKDEVNTGGFTLNLRSNLSSAWWANSGVELYADHVGSTAFTTDNGKIENKRGLYPDGASYGNYSAYTIHHITAGRWTIDAGARFNAFNIRISDTTLGRVVLRPLAVVGNVGLVYAITPGHRVYASFSSGYRAPNIDDMGTLGIVDFRYEIPAPSLKPERSRHAEIGYKMAARNFSATAAVFYMHITDLITRTRVIGQTIDGYPVYKKENTEEAYVKGAEAEIAWKPFSWLNAEAGIAYAYGTNLTRNEPLRRVPPINGRILLNGQYKRWQYGAEWLSAAAQRRLAQGDKDDNRIPKGGTPSWNVMNLYGGYKLGRFQIRLALQNLFNEDYRTHGSGINGIGRSLALMLNYKF